MACKKPFTRLSQCVLPTNYKLTFKPDLKNFTFEGWADITVQVMESVNEIKVNASELRVETCIYKGSVGEAEATICYSCRDEIVAFQFATCLKPGAGVLSLHFFGELNDKMRGFYRSKYLVGEEERYAAVTQFEATDARRCFPCWDEPAIKATFDITLIVPKDRVSLSNMPVLKTEDVEDDPDVKKIVYMSSPIMSTYLVAFVIGEFDYVEDSDTDGVLVRVYTPLGKKEQGTFALDVALKTLPFYREYFGIPYPLPKVDLIAIADFSAGAMENWGLITYRETALLVDPTESSSRIKQWVALVVGHELAHQWFGNLVTMDNNCRLSENALNQSLVRTDSFVKRALWRAAKNEEWWTHLWLNEGFASWIEYLCVDYCFPEYNVWTQFINNDLCRALEMDALDSSHPIEVEVGHPSEVDEIFDAISYSKGSSVIRMLHEYLGDEDYRKGMNIYLTRHQYKNTCTEDLWCALAEASCKPVAEIMKSWTKQMGFPVLKVRQEQCGEHRVVTVIQSKFMAGGGEPPEGYRWMIPVTACTQCDPCTPLTLGVMETDLKKFTLPSVPETHWVKINAGTTGFYRVMYPTEMLECLIPAVKNLSLQPGDRLGLQSDLFALSRAGMNSAVDVLRVVQAYENEKDFTVWTNMASNITVVSHLMQYTECFCNFQKFVRRLFEKIFTVVGWDAKFGEDKLTPMLREVVLIKLGKNLDNCVIQEAFKRFEAHYQEIDRLPADLRNAVYQIVLFNGDDTTFEKVMTLYDREQMQEEKVRIARALGSTQDPMLKKRVLDFSIGDKVRPQDTPFIVAGTVNNPEGRTLAWDFFKSNFKLFLNRYEGGFLLSRLVQCVSEDHVTEELAVDVESFFKENPVEAAERTIQRSIENIRINARWLERETDRVCKFLACTA